MNIALLLTSSMVFESIWTILPGFQWFFGTEKSQTQKQINTKVYSFLLCYFISIQCPISGKNLFHFSCFLVLLFIFPLVKTFRVIYGFMCYYCYRWNLCAQTFFIVPLLAVYTIDLLCKLEEYRAWYLSDI